MNTNKERRKSKRESYNWLIKNVLDGHLSTRDEEEN